ncbi:hypothetical protein KCU85_g5687, partial [Aureobasidium melanogenum]
MSIELRIEYPGPDTYIQAEVEFVQPVPCRDPPGPIIIRWMTPSNYPGGSVWMMQIFAFGPDVRIFDRITYDDNMVYWSQDTRTRLTRDATCASTGLHNNFRIFVSACGPSNPLNETARRV